MLGKSMLTAGSAVSIDKRTTVNAFGLRLMTSKTKA